MAQMPLPPIYATAGILWVFSRFATPDGAGSNVCATADSAASWRSAARQEFRCIVDERMTRDEARRVIASSWSTVYYCAFACDYY